MANATTASPAMMANPASERIVPKRLFAFIIMVFGMFMSILDIQIVSASLSEIQAGLSASQSEVSWVQTSYLIAEVIAMNHLLKYSGVDPAAKFNERLMRQMRAASEVRRYLQEDNE